jgi:hypothetical protein
MNNEQTDTALILENELKRRVSEVTYEIVRRQVKEIIDEEFVRRKNDMLLEVSLTVGKMLRLIEQEDRKPLWESTPMEFGLTNMELNTHSISGGKDAVRK